MAEITPLRQSKESAQRAQEKYRATDKFKLISKNSRYKRLYGISLDEYNEMLQNQNYVCKICHCPDIAISAHNNEIKNLAVDHCHSTGRVRGLLCDRCNHLLGLAQDSEMLLQKAMEYLKETT